MPELPEVETVKRQIESHICGEEIVAVKKSGFNLRKELGHNSVSLKGLKISSLSRWGKRLFVNFESSKFFSLDVSLGMSGMLRLEKKPVKKQKHDHLIFKLSNDISLIYNDPRRFGWIRVLNKPFKKEGWDPLLSSKKDYSFVVDKAMSSKKSSYGFLMDQKYVVGLGNIYVQEVLFMSGVSPFRPINECSSKELELIRKNSKLIVNKALKHGGSTVLSYTNSKGEKGSFQNKLHVYGKKKGEFCNICKTPLTHVKGVRSITFCSQCQD